MTEDPTGYRRVRFDPIDAFERTLMDLCEIVDIFGADDSPMTPQEYLAAVRTLGDRLKAISLFAMNGVTSAVGHKVPSDVRSEFEAQLDLENLMETPEDQMRRMLKAIEGIDDINKREGRSK